MQVQCCSNWIDVPPTGDSEPCPECGSVFTRSGCLAAPTAPPSSQHSLGDTSLELRCKLHGCQLQLANPGHWSPLHRESAGDFTFDLDAMFCPLDEVGGDCCLSWVVEL